MSIESLVDEKHAQWNREALLFCCQNGAKEGYFLVNKWANGEWMAEVPGALPNQAITVAQLQQLITDNWKIHS